MKIALFDTKSYDKHFFDEANKEYGYDILYLDAALNRHTAILARGCDVVCPFVNCTVDRDVIDILASEGVKLIALRSAGFNNTDYQYALKKGIPVVRVPAYSPHAVAEHSFALLLALVRKLTHAYVRTREFNFSLSGLVGIDLHGKTMGIVGTGKIGRAAIGIAKGFGMKVLAYDPYPAETHAVCQASDVVLFGAIGDPKYDNNPTAKVRPEQGLLRMRKSLGLFANLRPLAVFDSLAERSPLKTEIVKGADFLCVRELTGGMYFGRPQGRSEDGNTAYDTCVYTREEVERILKLAFELAQKRRKQLTVVDKANVIATSRLWRQIAKEIAPQYPDVTVEFMFVDNAAMQIIQRPTHFDVIVTENLFGDILTDESSVISGSLGMLPSASVGAKVALFEPIHGSYPQAAGKNIANPMATILSAAMMLEHVGLATEGKAIRDAVNKAIEAGVVTEDLADAGAKVYSTTEVGDYVAAAI